jgi:hypothetical protein
MRDGLDGVVAPCFGVGSRFKGSVRDGLNGTVADFAVGSRFKGSVRDGLNGTAGLGEAALGDGGLARTRKPAVRAVDARSGSRW